MINSPAETIIAAARSGDKQAFGDLVEPFRAELLVHCYRLLGSLQDAEDMVQEAFLRAWNHMESFEGGRYFRAWLYKIATNICLDALAKRSRRMLPSSLPASDPRLPVAAYITDPVWLEPFPDELLPEARYTQRESIQLAFLAALQLLPPRQRVTLILCDVLDWHAREVAQMLDITVPSVNGLLRRARATMNQHYRDGQSAPVEEMAARGILNQYADAWESGDVDALIALLNDQLVFTMPPRPSWFSGRDAVKIHAESMLVRGARDLWRLCQTRANGQNAVACYRRTTTDEPYRAHAIQVITLDAGKIVEVHMFLLPALFPRFGLPMELQN